MIDKIIRDWECGIPLLICSRSSRILGVNCFFDELLSTMLFEYMEPFDVLRFQAAFETGDRIIDDISLNFPKLCHCIAVFFTVSGCRLCAIYPNTVNIETSEGERLCPSPSEIVTFLNFLAKYDNEPLDKDCDKEFLLDLESVLPRCISDITAGIGNMDLTVELGCDADVHVFSSVGYGSLLQMLSAVLQIANELSCDGSVDARLCRNDGISYLDMRVKTDRLDLCHWDIDSICRAMPKCTPFVNVCKFAAECSGCIFETRVGERANEVLLLLSFDSRIPGDIDFKSRLDYSLYTEALDCVVKSFNEILSCAEQQTQ